MEKRAEEEGKGANISSYQVDIQKMQMIINGTKTKKSVPWATQSRNKCAIISVLMEEWLQMICTFIFVFSVFCKCYL